MEAQPQQSGFVIWVTGMNGSGKTTLASYVQKRLAAARPAELIDADDPENPLVKGLGQTKDDRDAAVRRVGYVVRLLARSGGIAVVAALSPYREPREQVRRDVRRFVEVFVDADMAVLQKRDAIYRRALAGEVRNVPGVDAPYEPPTHPDVTVKTDVEPTEEAAKRLFQALVDLKYIGPADFARITGGAKPKRTRPAARAGARRKLAAKAAERKAPKKEQGPKKAPARAAKARGKRK
jgi:adenylyl-sulfate kinase